MTIPEANLQMGICQGLAALAVLSAAFINSHLRIPLYGSLLGSWPVTTTQFKRSPLTDNFWTVILK